MRNKGIQCSWQKREKQSLENTGAALVLVSLKVREISVSDMLMKSVLVAI